MTVWKQHDGCRHGNINKNDLFGCQSMVTPTTRALVDGLLEDYARKWRALDDRRIYQDPSTMIAAANKRWRQQTNATASRQTNTPSWRLRHTQEQFFDITTELWDFRCKLPVQLFMWTFVAKGKG